MTGSHYETLGVPRDCTLEDLRRAYHRAARQFHPDKQQQQLSGPTEDADREAQFLRVQAAYELLRDPITRATYDQQLARDELCRQRDHDNVRIADEVPIEDLQREELPVEDADDDAEVLYSHPCRCGDTYEITEDELLEGVDIVPCNGCSLNIRVLGRPPARH